MKFETTKDVLLKGIQEVQSAISTKTSLPILSNILMEATDNNLILTTTDLDIGITSKIAVKPQVAGAITIPAKKFSDIIKELPDGETISVSVKKNNLVNIECGKSVFKIMGLPKEEFPQLPEFKEKDSMVLQQKKLIPGKDVRLVSLCEKDRIYPFPTIGLPYVEIGESAVMLANMLLNNNAVPQKIMLDITLRA